VDDQAERKKLDSAGREYGDGQGKASVWWACGVRAKPRPGRSRPSGSSSRWGVAC